MWPQETTACYKQKAIQSFKNHMISSVGGFHPDCPLQLWSKMLPTLACKINQLHPYATNPKFSAWHGINGDKYDHFSPPNASSWVANASVQSIQPTRIMGGVRAKRLLLRTIAQALQMPSNICDQHVIRESDRHNCGVPILARELRSIKDKIT